MTCESWLTHSIGSVWSWSSSSTAMPAKNTTTLASARKIAARAGMLPRSFTSRPSGPSRKSARCVGDLYSRMPRIASGLMMLLTQIATMPTASSRPNWRIIGTFAKYRAQKANTASNVTTSSAGPRLRAVSWMG